MITVNTPDGTSQVTRGKDFIVDWPDAPNDRGPGLEILDGPAVAATSKSIAYFAPGRWYGVLVAESETP